MTLSDLGSEIDKSREDGNLSSALRLYALAYYQQRSEGKLSGGPRNPQALRRLAKSLDDPGGAEFTVIQIASAGRHGPPK
jgi:predicted DNA-binding ribbon-helix-helix protein